LSLQNRVEKFLSNASYISFAIESKDAVLLFLFDKNNYHIFSNDKNFKDFLKYFEGRRMKFVIATSKEGETTICFFDLDNGDTLNIEGPKFINGNIHKFFESKVPLDRIFKFIMMGKSKDNDTLIMPETLMKNKPVEIYGYSVTDNRSE
jgi:hypothetical protein